MLRIGQSAAKLAYARRFRDYNGWVLNNDLFNIKKDKYFRLKV
jgi:hypothetical protein